MSARLKPLLLDSHACDIASVLRLQARERPREIAFRHLGDGVGEATSVTYAQLDRRARAIAGQLHRLGVAGEPLLLAYPAGIDFVAGLFGCFYAGCVAVPTTLPHRGQRGERFNGIVNDAGPRIALTTAAAAAQLRSPNGNGSANPADHLDWLATNEISDQLARHWSGTTADPEALAMLQYTSGSTSDPKGVMLSHANLMHNARAIHNAFAIEAGQSGSTDRAVCWLPTYHDMGLVGGVIMPIITATPIISMSPAAFLQNPVAWLGAISQYNATISGGPNFAYDLCTRKISDQERANLDLSSWSLAFVGSEPVQPGTLERFAEAFAPCGFRPEAFFPCYGLAEATLMVTGPERGKGATIHTRTEDDMRRVGCGRPIDGTRVVIVQPDKRTELPEGEVGEIWVAGPSVAKGYWREKARTRMTFKAKLASGNGAAAQGPFLRTGDLGFLRDGELFVTCRRDDLMIIRGVNHHPQDIEATARASHPLLAGHGGAAFSVVDVGDDRHVLVHEVTRNGNDDLGPVLDATYEAVLLEHDLALDAIVLVRAGTIPRTSSGKVQRSVCLKAYRDGALYVVAERCVDAGQAPAEADPDTAEAATWSEGFVAVYEHARRFSRADLAELTPTTPINALGLDSLQRVELVTSLEKQFGRRLPHTCEVQTLGELADVVQKHLIEGAGRPDTPQTVLPKPEELSSLPEFAELAQHEQLLRDVTGETPYFRVDEGTAGLPGHVRIDGRDVVNFCGYDYIGMSNDPQVADAVKAAIDRYGTSAGASRLVSGEKRIHRELEQALARFLNTPDAVTFVSGHATNVTTIGHLLGSDDLVVHDMLAHNSIIEGARLSGASRRSFGHNDWQALDVLLAETRHHYRRVLIAIEGVYSMDGDWPDLPHFVELKHKHRALLLVDEAHSLGTMGATGRGIAEHFDVPRDAVDLWMGTLSKSLASCGGFIAGSTQLVNYLKHTAPGFVYSVGLSPPDAAAARAALGLLEQQPQRVRQLRERARLFLELARGRGLDTGLAAGSPVVPLITGSSADSLRLSRALLDCGINVQPILSPAVPENAARLRFFITVNHTPEQIRTTVDAVIEERAKLQPNCSIPTDPTRRDAHNPL